MSEEKTFSNIQYIAHRINSIELLKTVDSKFGVELDLRDLGNKLVLAHDPFVTVAEDFEEYLKQYHHGLMILNIKSERIEIRVLELIKKHNIKDYFFLDSSFPMIVSLSAMKENNLAIRYSEFEPIENLVIMQGRAKYVWIDCFSHWPIDHGICAHIKQLGYKIVMVSPELQGRPEDIQKYAKELLNYNFVPDYICSKIPQIREWKKYLSPS